MHVDVARCRDGLGDGRRGDLVEDDAVDLLAQEVGVSSLDQVPGNRLPLAVGVGGEVDLPRSGDAVLEFLDDLVLVARDQILRREVVGHLDAKRALGQVADVAHRRLDGVAAAQVLGDRLRLGRRLDDDQLSPAAALATAAGGCRRTAARPRPMRCGHCRSGTPWMCRTWSCPWSTNAWCRPWRGIARRWTTWSGAGWWSQSVGPRRAARSGLSWGS